MTARQIALTDATGTKIEGVRAFRHPTAAARVVLCFDVDCEGTYLAPDDYVDAARAALERAVGQVRFVEKDGEEVYEIQSAVTGAAE